MLADKLILGVCYYNTAHSTPVWYSILLTEDLEPVNRRYRADIYSFSAPSMLFYYIKAYIVWIALLSIRLPEK